MPDLLVGDDLLLMRQLELVRRRKMVEMARHDAYFEGRQRLQHLGIAVPPELRDFETVINIPRMAVVEPERRQNLKAFLRGGSERDDPALREAFTVNNLGSQAPLVQTDAKVFGRGFVTVGANEDDPEHPLIRVEDPRSFTCVVDARKRSMLGAARFVKDDLVGKRYATLMVPGRTLQLVLGGSGWEIEDEGPSVERVPVVLFLNRPRTGTWSGISEMTDVIPLTDSIARLVTNMQVAAETHAVPSRWVAGMSKGDFIDPKTNKALPVWEAYFTAIMASSNKDARFGQFSAGDLKNFHDAVNNLFAWSAAVLGLPTRYAGQQSVNPATEGAIRADEARLIANVERMNARDADCWSWVMGLYERFRTGEWVPANAIRTTYHDPATPTRSQMADATVKLFQAGILSREGAWDEMGWSPERKDQERQYLSAEAADPITAEILREVRGAGNSQGALSGATATGGAGATGGTASP